MPAYDYDCAACGRRFEVIHGVHADGPTTCPLCGKGPVRKAISAAAVHYKGSGWAKKERRATVTSAPSATRRSGQGLRHRGARRGAASVRPRRPAAKPDAAPRPTPPRPETGPPRPAPTDRDASRDGLDHPRRGGRDPGRRQHPLHARHDRRLGSGGPAPEHQARRPTIRPARRGPGARSPHPDACGPGMCKRSCSRTWAADTGRPMDPAAILRRFLDRPRVAMVRRVLDIYGRAPGGLLANGLAFSALFAAILALLVAVSAVGRRPATRRREIVWRAAWSAIPPPTDLIDGAHRRRSPGAALTSIIGFVGVIWTVSQLYGPSMSPSRGSSPRLPNATSSAGRSGACSWSCSSAPPSSPSSCWSRWPTSSMRSVPTDGPPIAT